MHHLGNLQTIVLRVTSSDKGHHPPQKAAPQRRPRPRSLRKFPNQPRGIRILVPRGESHDLRCQQPHRKPNKFAQELPPGGGTFGDVEVDRGPHAEAERENAAGDETVCPPRVRLVEPPRSAGTVHMVSRVLSAVFRMISRTPLLSVLRGFNPGIRTGGGPYEERGERCS